MPLHIQTPLIESRALSIASGRSIWLKMDALQPTGAFKTRGVGHACEVYAQSGARRFVCSSGGNAGLAVAYAGRKLSIPATVVVPESTTERACELLLLEQAELIVHGASWQEANLHALSLVGADDAFLHPFDDPLLWEGHSSLVDEVLAAGLRPDAIVLSVGGGGLLCGIAQGLHRNGCEDIPIVAVETTGAASFHQACKAGEPVPLDAITSIATSLGAKQVCDQAVRWVTEHPIHSALVSDFSALNACERFVDDHRVLVEPACGASLALAYDLAPELEPYDRVLIVVCGGATATLEQIWRWRDQLGSK